MPRRGIEPGTIRLQFQHVIGHRGGLKVVENYITYRVHYYPLYIIYLYTLKNYSQQEADYQIQDCPFSPPSRHSPYV